MTRSVRTAAAVGLAAALAAGAAGVTAHEMTFKGTVAAVEKARVQVKTIDAEGREKPEWFAPNEKTKVLRGEKRVAFEEARIEVGERIVVIVDHGDDDVMRVLEIRLAAK